MGQQPADLTDDFPAGVVGVGHERLAAGDDRGPHVRQPLQTLLQFCTFEIGKTVVGPWMLRLQMVAPQCFKLPCLKSHTIAVRAACLHVLCR